MQNLENYIAEQERKIAQKDQERLKVESELKIFKEQAASVQALSSVQQTSMSAAAAEAEY